MNQTFDTGGHDGGETRAMMKLGLGAILLVLGGLGIMMLDDSRLAASPAAPHAAIHHGK